MPGWKWALKRQNQDRVVRRLSSSRTLSHLLLWKLQFKPEQLIWAAACVCVCVQPLTHISHIMCSQRDKEGEWGSGGVGESELCLRGVRIMFLCCHVFWHSTLLNLSFLSSGFTDYSDWDKSPGNLRLFFTLCCHWVSTRLHTSPTDYRHIHPPNPPLIFRHPITCSRLRAQLL